MSSTRPKKTLEDGSRNTCVTSVDWEGKGWGRLDSNQRTRKRRDLQSLAIGHSATSPKLEKKFAGERIRTLDRPITNRLLYQLSYTSNM